MKTPTHRQSRATAIAVVAFATLVFTTALAATQESWLQRIEADWLLAGEVAAQDQLGGLVTTKAAAAGCDGIAPLVLRD
jgi:hypothetical protein